MNRRNFIKNIFNHNDSSKLLVDSTQHLQVAVDTNRVFNTNSINTNKILVLIQLIGGNDGLNSFIPIDQYDNLVKHRSNVLIKENKIIKLSSNNGLHPALKEFYHLYQEGLFTCIQDVGYPNQNRSHFRSMDIWNSGSSSSEMLSSGWIGRYLDLTHTHYPINYPNEVFTDPIAISIGNIVADTCQGKISNYSFALNNDLDIEQLNEYEIHNTPFENYNQQLQFFYDSISLTNKYSLRINEAKNKGNNYITYPDKNLLAQQLKLVARLISGGLKTNIFTLTLGGFDTHAYQTTEDTSIGWHANLLKDLAEAIYHFQLDLNKLFISKDIITMTYSEFGRQIASNASNGTDHGTATPIFIFGNNFKNSIVGQNATILDKLEPQAGVDMQFDFRDVYATILNKWLGVKNDNINSIFNRKSTIIDDVFS